MIIREEILADLPLITIGIPNYNYSHYIVAAMESAVAQIYPNIELLIVDDCSTDNSVEVIENWIKKYSGQRNILFLKGKYNYGLTKACNLILQKSKGKYLQILDADDIFYKDKILKNVNIFLEHPEAALVYSDMALMNEEGVLLTDNYLQRIGYDEAKMPQGNIFEDLFSFNFIAYPLINIEMAKSVNGFDESQQVHDYYLWLKLAEKYEIYYCPGKYAVYRIHENSMSNNSKTNVISVENVLRTKYRYLGNRGKKIDKIIKRDIFNSVTTLYENNFYDTGTWLKRNLHLNPGLKSFLYYLSFKIGIPFSFFIGFKKMLFNKK